MSKPKTKKTAAAKAEPAKTLEFPGSSEFRAWLESNHDKCDGVWLRFFKKASKVVSVKYAEALDHSLCFGWIDGQVRPFDERSWIQKFTPRRARSSWSKRNTEHVDRLAKAGLMHAAGQKAIDAAKADGRWAAAYDSPRNAVPPADFLKALESNKKAKEFFATLNRANIYYIVYNLQTAKKPETRERRFKMIMESLERGRKFH